MPVMDGVEATWRIRALPGGDTVKIVAVTASVFAEEQQQLLDAGMDAILRKPYRFYEIYDALALHLGVKYTYRSQSHEKSPPPAPPVTLTPAMLAALPPAIRYELSQALDILDGERIAAVIGTIRSIDAELARTLGCMADNFDYSQIISALEPGQPGMKNVIASSAPAARPMQDCFGT
jgi:DNA-binding NarL/FixJ family response regulator